VSVPPSEYRRQALQMIAARRGAARRTRRPAARADATTGRRRDEPHRSRRACGRTATAGWCGSYRCGCAAEGSLRVASDAAGERSPAPKLEVTSITYGLPGRATLVRESV
jgi:hypothetical protein